MKQYILVFVSILALAGTSTANAQSSPKAADKTSTASPAAPDWDYSILVGGKGKGGETRTEHVDREILRVRRIDIVDKAGVIRMTIAGELPSPIINGVEYPRDRPVGGIMLRDENGNERGGIAWATKLGAAIVALDFPNGEAIGFNVLSDGSTNFQMLRPTLVGRKAGEGGSSGVFMNIDKTGNPSVGLSDAQDRTRVRLAITPEGYGAVEFLDATGKVIQTLSPERDALKP